jgi:5'-nucleotidase
MRILVSNDDGIHAEGLSVLVEELRREHEVFVFAPDQERSGVSHAMSLKQPGKVRKLSSDEYSCSGTPADCIILGNLGAVPFRPEVVVSGINRGPNLGTDIVYSGTCGAARQAVLFGFPALAVSCASFHEPLQYRGGAVFVRKHLASLVAKCPLGTFLNINAPSVDSGDLQGRWALPSKRKYLDRLRSFDAPDGYAYCFLSDTAIETEAGPDSDHEIVARGEVSISAILAQPQALAVYPSGTRWV